MFAHLNVSLKIYVLLASVSLEYDLSHTGAENRLLAYVKFQNSHSFKSIPPFNHSYCSQFANC
jgi:hypothetical protein